MVKLHLGCGAVGLKGWVNIDADSAVADVKHDLRTALPYESNSVDFVYHEHLIEHFNSEDGVRLLKETHRVLRDAGTVRIATPDLDYVVLKYWFGWRRQDWIHTYGYTYIQTRAEMMNAMFHFWEHKWLYNREELDRRLREAGFQKIRRVRLGQSRHPELRNLETRKDSKLIVEATK